MAHKDHSSLFLSIFQIDCEGCEFASIPPLFELISAGNVRVNQILVEMHARGISKKTARALYDFFLAADRAKFRITHKERNHWGCKGYRCVEYSLVSESFLRYVNGNVVCPEIGDI